MLSKFPTIAVLLASLCAACAQGSEIPQSKTPYTSFQTHQGYVPEHDIRTDAAIVYTPDKTQIQSWIDKGYVVQTMYGFRAYKDYVDQHPEETQTDAQGNQLTCGPGSFYMVPTENRIKFAIDWFTAALNNGSSAVLPEEPEYFARAGYEGAFKEAWAKRYGEPWQDPASSIFARYKSEKLKAEMTCHQIKSIIDAGKAVKPSCTGMVAIHSPVNYFSWRVAFPFQDVLNIQNLDEIVGQVWTGTARSACKYAGKRAERTFENGYLEYSSLWNLVRGTNKRMWFLMDPLEDNPNLPMEDYHVNYERTLIASLMFPEVDAYEVMPWPSRIYGRISDDYETEISTVINVLQDMHNQKTWELDLGTRGIATFLADSAAYQRELPTPSTFDSFYGLTLPLIYRGIPVQVAQLERVVEKGYLDAYKLILLSYDMMKPMKPEYNQAISDWVKRGGTLIFFGGTDPYNDLPLWWKDAGFATPQQDLYARLGANVELRGMPQPEPPKFIEIGRTDARYTMGENMKTHSFDLTPFAKDGTVFVKFRDAYQEDGWGPFLTWVELKIDGRSVDRFLAGAPRAKKYMWEDGGSLSVGEFRFADAADYWVYKFDVNPGAKVELLLDICNQFLIEASNVAELKEAVFEPRAGASLSRSITVPRLYALTLAQGASRELLTSSQVEGCAAFEEAIGKGFLMHIGIAPSYFANSTSGANELIDIVRLACDRAKLKYEEKNRMQVKRGPYVALRTYNSQHTLDGDYINLLDPKLPVMRNPVIERWSHGLFLDVTRKLAGAPKVLYSSSRIESRKQAKGRIDLKLSGPLNTGGVVRLYTGNKRIAVAPSEGMDIQESGNTVLISYDNKPEGVDLNIQFE